MIDGLDYSRSPVAEVVKHKVSGTVRYLLGLPDSIGDASVSTTYSWQSNQVGGLNLIPLGSSNPDPFQGRLPAYGVLNARADWKNVMGHPVDLSAFCDNLTNKTYLTLMNSAWTLGEDVGQYAPPRMYGVSVRVHF